MKKQLLVLIILFFIPYILIFGQQSTFGVGWSGPSNTFGYSSSDQVINPSSYYSPVDGDMTLPSPSWLNCASYNVNGTIVTNGSQMPNHNPIPGATDFVGWDTRSFKPYTNSKVNFRILLPPGYNQADINTKYPVILFLHGYGEAGEILYPGSLGSCDVRWHNNINQLKWGGSYHLNIVQNDPRYKAIVIFPQNENGDWQYSNSDGNFIPNDKLSSVMSALQYITGGGATTNGVVFNIDPNRVYLEGLSNGGNGEWSALYNYTQVFAGSVITSSSGLTDQTYINKLKYTGIWQWQGGLDNTSISLPANSNATYQALANVSGFKRDHQTDITSGGPINGTATNHYVGNKRYLEESNEGHGVFTDCYSHPDYWKWLFSQNILNIVPFSDTAICSGSSIKIGIQPGFAEYDWQYSVDGSTYSSTLPLGLANNTNDINVTELGFYRVRLQRTSLGWSYYSQTIQIIRKASTPAQVISQNNSTILPSLAGNNLTLSAPTGFTNYIWSTGSNNISINASTAGTYYVSVKSSTLCQGINSDPLTVLTGQLPLSTIASPSNLQTFTITATSINLSWVDNSNNESGFEIFRSSDNGASYVYVGLTSVNANNYIDNSLNPNTTYTYKIRAMKKAVGASDYTNFSVSPTLVDNIPPTKPTNLTSSGLTSTSVNLSWTASTDNVGVVGYDIYANGSIIGSTSGTTFSANGLTSGSSYIFKVVAKDAKPNYSQPSDDLQVFTYLNSLVSGLNYEYYENSYTNLNSPLFGSDVPKKTGYINNFSLNPRLRDKFNGFNFYGFITIPTSGSYTFYTESDDGSNLFVNNTQVVANDFNQGMTERSGSISLSAGTYPIQVTFRQGDGGFGLNVRWSGPGIPKNLIPDNVLFRNALPAGLYYTNIANPLNVTPSWGDSPDGTGNQPNFLNSSQIFYITKNNATLGGNLTVGSNSKIVIMNNADFTLDKTFNGIIDIQGNGQLTIKNSTAPTFGSVSTTSTVIFNAVTSVSSNTTLGNVILKSGTTTINGSNLNILGDLTFQGGSFAGSGLTSITVNGNINLGSSVNLPINLSLNGGSQTITGNGFNFNVTGLNLISGSSVSLSTIGGATNLSCSGNVVIQNQASLNINSNIITLTGNSSINPGTDAGMIKINNGSISLNSTNAGNSNLYFDPSLNTISNFTINNTSSGSVFLNNILNLNNTLTLQNGNLNTTNGNLILKSNAVGTARIAKVQNGASLTGNITQERYIAASSSGKGWFFISTPIKNQTVADWTNEANIKGQWQSEDAFPTIHQYKENMVSNRALNDPKNYENYGWFGLTNKTDPINKGQGYKIYLYNEFFTSRNSTLQNTGAPVIGDGVDGINAGGAEAFNFNITYTPATGYNLGGWNLISNPFPSDIDWTVSGWSRSAVDNAIYIWNSQSNNGKGSYEALIRNALNDVIKQTPNATGRIASGQAFFIRANGANPTLSATEDVKTSTATSFFRKETPENLLRITLLNQKNESSSTVVYFTKHATSNFDSQYDAHLLTSGNINLGSFSKDKKELSINGLSSMNDSIPLTLKHNAKGNYSLNFSSLETFKTDTKIFLSDKFNKTITKLNSNQNYSFNITQDTNTFVNRFALIFQPNNNLVSGNIPHEVETSKVFSVKSIYPNPFNVEANLIYNLPEEGMVEINIINSRGQLIEKITNPSKTGENLFVWNPRQRNINLTSGLYFYNIQYNQKSIAGKMIYINQ